MTTLSTDAPRTYAVGPYDDLPVIASEIIYQGAAVGLVAGTGHARPLVAGDRFAGFAESQCDNSTGAAAAKRVRVLTDTDIVLSVSGAVITDVGQPVYASDDATFSFSPVGGSFIGFVRSWQSAGVVVVDCAPARQSDPYGRWSVREAVSDNKTLAAADCGKLFWVDTDAKVVTLPAVAAALSGVCLVNGGAFGAVALTIAPNASDLIRGPGITAANDKDIVNTKATARRGDRLVLGAVDADGYTISELVGTWAREG